MGLLFFLLFDCLIARTKSELWGCALVPFRIVRHGRRNSCFVILIDSTERDWISNRKPRYIQEQGGKFFNVLKQVKATTKKKE